MIEVSFEPTKKLIVHDDLEYTFDDLLQEYEDEANAGGPTIRKLTWADGVAFTYAGFGKNPEVERDVLNGIIHYSWVEFALKEKFEKQIIRGGVTIHLIDDSEVPLFYDLATALKERSRYKK